MVSAQLLLQEALYPFELQHNEKSTTAFLPFHPGFWYCYGCEIFFACQRSFRCVPGLHRFPSVFKATQVSSGFDRLSLCSLFSAAVIDGERICFVQLPGNQPPTLCYSTFNVSTVVFAELPYLKNFTFTGHTVVDPSAVELVCYVFPFRHRHTS